jgi:hypothetical protein
MSSLIHRLQNAIIDKDQSVTQLLRQTKLIAAKLNLADVEKWVDLELKGYPEGIKPPKYRQFSTETVEIRNPVRGWEFAGYVSVPMFASQPLAEIENLANGESLTLPVPAEKNFQTRSITGERETFGANWPQRFTMSGSQFKHIVEGVRNELLEWTTQLEKRGIKGEDMDFDEQEKKTAGNMTFNIGTVQGNVGNVSHSQANIYDSRSIQNALREQNVPKETRRELEDIMDAIEVAPVEKKVGLIAGAEKWLVKHKDSLGAATEIVGRAIKALSSQHGGH